MPQEYQDPIKSVIDGLLMGHQIASQIKHQKLQDEAAVRSAERDQRESGIQEILNEMRIRQAGGIEVNNGMVEEYRPDVTMPGQDLGDGVKLPDSTVPGGRILRKAKGTVKLPMSGRQFELPDEEQQLQRQRRAQDVETQSGLDKLRQEAQLKGEMAVSNEQNWLDRFGIEVPEPGGAGKKRKVRPEALGDIGRYESSVNPKPSEPTGDRAIFEKVYLPGWLEANGIAPNQATATHRMKALSDFQKAKDAGPNERARLQRELTERGQNMTDTRGRELNDLNRQAATDARDAKPATSAQSTVALYAARIKQSEPILQEIEQGIGERVYNKLAPNFMQTEKGQAFDQAERNFINSVLRRESGAVISPSEFTEARKQYIPQPGDKPKALEQKKANRLVVQQSFIKAAGKAYEDPDKLLKDAGALPSNPAAPKTADQYLKSIGVK